jgi:hypothetical protein
MFPGLIRTHGQWKFCVILQGSSWARLLDFGPIVQRRVGLYLVDNEVEAHTCTASFTALRRGYDAYTHVVDQLMKSVLVL